MQQVNLYLPELRPRRDWPNSRDLVLVTAAFLVIMLVVQIIWGLRAGSARTQVEEQQIVVAEVQARLDKLQPSAAVVNQSFDSRIARLESAIANREKVARLISGQNMGNSEGFYIAMQVLAAESHRDLALDHFTFSRGGNYVEMHGSARNAEAVPLYLQRLKADPAFNLARFGLLSVSSERAAHEFSLGYDSVYDKVSQATSGGRN